LPQTVTTACQLALRLRYFAAEAVSFGMLRPFPKPQNGIYGFGSLKKAALPTAGR
jgi:hypothetical protein